MGAQRHVIPAAAGVAAHAAVSGEIVWSGHMATCDAGAGHDRKALGITFREAHNPYARTREGFDI